MDRKPNIAVIDGQHAIDPGYVCTSELQGAFIEQDNHAIDGFLIDVEA
ncbi:hypothetical protein [Vibrio gallaecicus]|nr:hypothetical protein [Vibrio gallaecicus]MDN3617367.1 hypothetical protein [Vibrio gallaecicus]